MQYTNDQMISAYRKANGRCQCQHEMHNGMKLGRCGNRVDWDRAVFVPAEADPGHPHMICRECAEEHARVLQTH